MQVLLGDDVAAAGEPGVLLPDQYGRGGGLPTGILRPAHETEQVAFLEIAEPVDLVLHRDRPREPVHDLGGHLETQVHAHGLDVEEQIAGRGDGDVLRPGQFRERMQTGGPRAAEQPVPGGRADPGHARQRACRHAGAHRPLQAGQVGQQAAHGLLASGVDPYHQEDRRARRRAQHRLRYRRHGLLRIRHVRGSPRTISSHAAAWMIANSPGPFAGIQDIGRPAPPSVHRHHHAQRPGDEAAQGRGNRAGSAVSSPAGRAARTGRIAVVLCGPAPPIPATQSPQELRA